MINLRICAIAAGGAFLVSSFAGLVGGADLLTIVLRALFFGALSFGFVAGAQQLIAQFLPELLGGASSEPFAEEASAEDVKAEPDKVGERVDVSVGDDEDDDLPQLLGGNAEKDEDTILAPSGLDQRTEGGYTEEQQVAKPAAVAARPPSLLGDVDVLPDLEGFADSFVTPISVDQSDDRPQPRSVSSSTADDGRFDPKEMAMAIQTMLKRDQKG